MNARETAWDGLVGAARAAKDRPITSLFDNEPDRLETLCVDVAGLRVDLSKQPLSLTDLNLALDLVHVCGVEAARDQMFAGDVVNRSEQRPALHPALRAPVGSEFKAQGVAVSSEIDATRKAMDAFATSVRSGTRRGSDGQTFKAIVHIGIGGSDLGPRLIWQALRPLEPEIDLRFAANVDPSELAFALAGLDPARTLVVVVSKTFTTEETLANARVARAWLRQALGPQADRHLLAVTAAPAVAQAFGVTDDQVFAFWDWVGGRYSIWSAVGLSCAIALGPEVFAGLLAGAAAMDEHFCTAPLADNAPVLLALAHIYNRNGLGRPIRAVIPYAQRLALFPAFLQQLEMESNGKRVAADSGALVRDTAACVFGDAGTNGQHAFFQMLHQGTVVIPVDFIAVANAREGDPKAQTMLLANVVAQAEALLVGRPGSEALAELKARGLDGADAESLAIQRTFPGNRPSSFILIDDLTPETLGALIALYEHKVFVEGVLWGINSFDQWGVELGKSLASRILPELEGRPAASHDPSTAALIARLSR